MTQIAESFGLKNDDDDPCLFTWSNNYIKVILIIYVDDLILASNDLDKPNELKSKFMNGFEMTDMKEPLNRMLS